MEAMINGARLRFETAGEAKRPALVLTHGFPLDSAMWDAQLAPLAEVCYVIAPDLRGHGQSELVGAVSMAQHADDLAGVLDHLGIEQATLAGLSMGGYVALEFCRRHEARVAGLALIDTRANADTSEAKAGRSKTIDRIRKQGIAVLADDMLPKLLARGHGDLTATLRSMILRQSVEGMAAALAAMRDRADSIELLPTITAPAAVVVGAADALTPVEVAEDMAGRMPHARLTVAPGAGHMSPMEAPQQVNAALLDLARRVREAQAKR